jgi:hypothetical protein
MPTKTVATPRPRAATVRKVGGTKAAPVDQELKDQVTKDLTRLAKTLEDRRRTKQAAEQDFTEAEASYLHVAAQAKALGVKVTQVPFTATNGVPMAATFVDGTGKNTSLDDGKLQTKLGADRWKKVTKPVLDKTLLQAAVDKGIVQAAEVAACMNVGDKKSYASFSVRTKDIADATVKPTGARRIRRPVKP